MDYTVHAEWSLFLYLFPQLFIDVLKLDPGWRQCFRLGTAVLPRLCYCPNWRCESAAESAQSSKKKTKLFTWGSVFFRSPSLLSRPNLVTVWLSHNQRLTDRHIDLSMKNQWGRVMGGSRRVSWSQRGFFTVVLQRQHTVRFIKMNHLWPWLLSGPACEAAGSWTGCEQRPSVVWTESSANWTRRCEASYLQ